MDDAETTTCLNGAKRQHVDRSSAQRKSSLRLWFKFLLLFCLGAFVLCYTLPGSVTSQWVSDSFQKHYERIFSRIHQNISHPPYKHYKDDETTRGKIPETTPGKTQLTTPGIIQETTPGIIQETTAPKTTLPTEARTGIQFHQAYPRNYHFIMDNTEVCNTRKPFLVLMVPVAPNNVAARDAIRQTWGSSSLVQGKVVLTLFLLGLPSGADFQQQQEKVRQENQQHHDLIQSDFMDTYLNLTIKTMVIMDWLATRCPTAAYAMKIDSDMFLNIDNLMVMLQKPGIPKTKYLTGYVMWNIPVIRSMDSKWYVSEELYPDPQYPTYTLGMGYVFSNDLPQKFVEVSTSITPFNIEDAYIGMCMKKLGFPVTPPPDPGQFRTYNIMYNRCEYSKIITYILGSSEELVRYWTDLKKPGPPC
ncbi:beta-1,3-galactosyltransferase 1-like [Betta splendens]|uniref:Hexosyltransferase n=1 Tax=Betta splendens TaxID=158456 RepID=A0A6P7NFA5_BETSP|nr:beta-1,3-galactosyltransferase 1-like [Betta splendens]